MKALTLKQGSFDDSPGRPANLPARLGSPRARIILALSIVFAAWGWFDVRLRGTVDPDNPGIHKTDLTVYTEAGAAFFDGRDPYKVTNPRGWGYLYPPAFAMLIAPLHALPPRAQVLVWFALSTWMVWGCCSECVRIGRVVLPGQADRGLFGPIPSWIGYASIAAALLPALNCLQRGQVGIAKLYLLLLGFRLLVESRSRARSFLAGCVLATPIVLKLTPLAPVLFVLYQRFVAGRHADDRRAALSRVRACSMGMLWGLVLCLLILPASLVGWRANLLHLDTWWHSIVVRAESTYSDDFAGDSSSKSNQSLTNAVRRLGNWADYIFADGPNDEKAEGGRGLLMDSPVVTAFLLAARIAAGCLLLAVGFRTGRAQDDLVQAAGFGLACVSTLVIAPIARGHYYVLFLPATMFLGLWLLGQQRPRLAIAYVFVPVALVVSQYALRDVAGRVGVLGLGTMLWYTAAGVLLLLPRRGNAERQDSSSPGAERCAPEQSLAA